MTATKIPFLKRLVGEKSGNAVLFTALGMPVLIGAAGYAMDMAQMYAWKRELQHSVDQAALAGAWALAYDKNTQSWSRRAQQEYDANQLMMADHDTAPSIQLGSYGGQTNNSVIVSSRVTKRLPFSGFLVNKSMTVFASAQATYAEGGTYQACLMALKKGEGGTFSSRMEAKDGSFGFDFAGTYTKIVPHELIEYSFGDRTARVEFQDGPKGVLVRVTFESEPEHSINQQREGWQAILNNFARHVERRK